MAHQVTAAVAVVKTSDGLKYLYQNAFIPADVDQEHLVHLVAMGLVEEVEDEEKARTAAAAKAEKAAAAKAKMGQSEAATGPTTKST